MNTAGTDENLLTLVPVPGHGARVLSLELAPVPRYGAQISAPAPTKGYVQTDASARAAIMNGALVLKILTQLLCDHSLDLFWNVITTTTTTTTNFI